MTGIVFWDMAHSGLLDWFLTNGRRSVKTWMGPYPWRKQSSDVRKGLQCILFLFRRNLRYFCGDKFLFYENSNNAFSEVLFSRLGTDMHVWQKETFTYPAYRAVANLHDEFKTCVVALRALQMNSFLWNAVSYFA
jgi:hypothetical protein